MPSIPWRVEFSKIFQIFFFKIPKRHKIVPKSIQTCFERVLGQTFRKIFLPSVPWRVEFSKIFKKNIFKIQKMPKSALKRIQTCFDCNLNIFFEKFLPSFPWKVESSKIFKKIKKVSNFLKRPKSFPKVSKRVLIVIWTIFSKNFCPVFHGRSSLRKFSKKPRKFQIS